VSNDKQPKPIESTDPVREHLAAAENYLAIAEEGFQRLYEEPPAVIREDTFRGTGAKMRTALQLAEQHRKMAETYWNTYPPQRWSQAPSPSPSDLEAMKQAVAEKIDPPCACCTSELFSASATHQEICGDCGHSVGRHNDNADPAERARRDFALPERHTKCGPACPAPEAPDVLDVIEERRKAVQELSDQEFEDMLTLAAEERRRRMAENGVRINAQQPEAPAPKPWKSGGGAGQWNG
jgi:hypothetical protein